ncbi:hypothetical protein BJX64DRAFT_10893 [Aspergillus heterothallicus]
MIDIISLFPRRHPRLNPASNVPPPNSAHLPILAPYPPGFGFEESYASPRHPHTSPSGNKFDGRRRRNKGSSRDQHSSRELDGFFNEDLRVGGPYLCSVPVESIEIPESDPWYQIITGDHDLDDKILVILCHAGVHSIGLPKICYRQSKIEPESLCALDPTLLIIARRPSIDRTWINTARDLRGWLRLRGYANINVEIAHPVAFKPVSLYPIEIRHPIIPLWPQISSAIRDSFPVGSGIIEITCFRVGKGQVPAENPVTVFVGTSQPGNHDWRHGRETIVRILDRFHLSGVAVFLYQEKMSWFGVLH